MTGYRYRGGPPSDQGTEPSSVGHAAARHLAGGPVPSNWPAAAAAYAAAQEVDPWPGESYAPARDDLTPIDVAALPPWPCCGARGLHARLCPLFDTPEGD